MVINSVFGKQPAVISIHGDGMLIGVRQEPADTESPGVWSQHRHDGNTLGYSGNMTASSLTRTEYLCVMEMETHAFNKLEEKVA